jgi:WD40 repeat protein
MVNYW